MIALCHSPALMDTESRALRFHVYHHLHPFLLPRVILKHVSDFGSSESLTRWFSCSRNPGGLVKTRMSGPLPQRY